MTPKLNIIVPCYNEEAILPKTADTLGKILDDLIHTKQISKDSQICFINDGSQDKTLVLIKKLIQKSTKYSAISFSRNFGHQPALLAGLFETKADIYITIDADLQDDPSKIKDMVQKYSQGNEIVYGVRSNRETDSYFKRKTAELFYKLQYKMGIKSVYNSADFRLLGARPVAALKQFPEKNLFLRGLIPLLGFQSDTVSYPRKARELGETKYPFWKMCSFALNGIIGFSCTPIRIVTALGLVMGLIGFLLLLWGFYRYCIGETIPGWTSLFSILAFFNGITVFSIGLIGEYIGKIFTEVKSRPTFIIDQKIGFPDQKKK